MSRRLLDRRVAMSLSKDGPLSTPYGFLAMTVLSMRSLL
jgi:hypothetical protein